VNKAIITIPGSLLASQCAFTGSPFDCSRVTRYAAGGYTIWGVGGQGFVDQTLVNGSALKTNGIDVNADYHVALTDWHLPDYGSLNFSFTGTYVSRLVTVLPDGSGYNCAGLYGVFCGTPTPHWRHQFRMTWNTPWNLTLSAAWRHLSSASLDFNTDQPVFQDGYKDVFKTDAHIPTYDYFDFSFQYKIHDRYTLRGGVNNIFERTPPLLDANSFGISSPPFGNGNTYPQVYDPLGRVFFVGLTADF
jgi:outer membrane receptor protein involved in Fe transport